MAPSVLRCFSWRARWRWPGLPGLWRCSSAGIRHAFHFERLNRLGVLIVAFIVAGRHRAHNRSRLRHLRATSTTLQRAFAISRSLSVSFRLECPTYIINEVRTPEEPASLAFAATLTFCCSRTLNAVFLYTTPIHASWQLDVTIASSGYLATPAAALSVR
jgi:hypothetical protein